MSFIYAEKAVFNEEGHIFPMLHVFSDTKLSFDEHSPNKANWGVPTLKRVEKYGIVKSMILSPKHCISFAGNDIAYVQDLLDYYYAKQSLPDDELLAKAFELHKAAGQDEIEFIVCTVDDENKVHITCIKDGQLQSDCARAWIGSYKVFRKLREQQIQKAGTPEEHDTSLGMIKYAVENGGDSSVGGFIVQVRYDEYLQSFVYSERLETSLFAPQLVPLGAAIRLTGTASEGACSIHYRESSEDVIIDFEQGDFSVAYTRRFRYEADVSNQYIRHFMLPLLFQTSTNKVIEFA